MEHSTITATLGPGFRGGDGRRLGARGGGLDGLRWDPGGDGRSVLGLGEGKYKPKRSGGNMDSLVKSFPFHVFLRDIVPFL